MGRWHAYYARRLGAEVAAVVDPASAAAQALARAAGGAGVFAEVGAMLAAVRPAAMHICTPLASHTALALEAVEAGVHALIEKPLTPDAGQARALLERARQKSVHVCPVHQFAFQQGVARAARALPGMGEPLHAHFTICSAGGGAKAGPELDAIVADILPHPFSVLQALWPGNPLRAADWTASSGHNGELRVQGRAGAVAVDVYVSMHARPTRCDLDILCSEGSIQLNFFHGYAVVRRGRPSRMDKISQPFRYAGKSAAIAAMNLASRALRREMAYPGLGNLIGRFYETLGIAGESPISAQDTLAAAILREHVIRQAIPGVLLQRGGT
jgi:predicted dehydrogenase